MKRAVFAVCLLVAAAWAEVQNIPASAKFLTKNIPVVDIRTPGEWKQTGIVKGAHTIMFFDERGGYDVQAFLKALNQAVDTQKPFALICNTGSRTAMISDFLDKELHYKVINLQGGIVELMRRGYRLVPYEK